MRNKMHIVYSYYVSHILFFTAPLTSSACCLAVKGVGDRGLRGCRLPTLETSANINHNPAENWPKVGQKFRKRLILYRAAPPPKFYLPHAHARSTLCYQRGTKGVIEMPKRRKGQPKQHFASNIDILCERVRCFFLYTVCLRIDLFCYSTKGKFHY